jgi:hypothetical protein
MEQRLPINLIGIFGEARMKNILLSCLFLTLCSSMFAQKTYEYKNSSKSYNVRLTVENCDENTCAGEAKFSIFRKGKKKAFQTLTTKTEFRVEGAKQLNPKILHNYEHLVFFEDYNFDGIKDLAIRDGNHNFDEGPSYQIYLFSPKRKRFIHSRAFTNLNQTKYIGAMQVDYQTKVLRAFSREYNRWESVEEFKVVRRNRLKKVSQKTEDYTDANRVKITTKRLVKGRWQTKVKYVGLSYKN